MKKFVVSSNDEGQTLVKYCSRILPAAPMSVIRKALRKKNIDLNKKKADGNDIWSMRGFLPQKDLPATLQKN